MIYLVRHGQTNWNKEGKIQGVVDIPLNVIGIMQAMDRRGLFKDHHFTHVYTSPLSRAEKTAELLTSKSKVDDFIVTDDLIEFDFGLRNGVTFANDPKRLEDGESTDFHEEDEEHFIQRLSRILIEAGTKEGNIMLVTHGAVISAYLQMLMPPEMSDKFIHLYNNSICCIDNRFDEDGNLILTLLGANMGDEQVEELLSQND